MKKKINNVKICVQFLMKWKFAKTSRRLLRKFTTTRVVFPQRTKMRKERKTNHKKTFKWKWYLIKHQIIIYFNEFQIKYKTYFHSHKVTSTYLCICRSYVYYRREKRTCWFKLQRKLSNETFMPSNFIFKVKNIMFICLCVNITLDFENLILKINNKKNKKSENLFTFSFLVLFSF